MGVITRGIPDDLIKSLVQPCVAVSDAERASRARKAKKSKLKAVGRRVSPGAAEVYAISEDGQSEQIVSVSQSESERAIAAAQKLAQNPERRLSRKEYDAARDGTIQAFVRARFAKKGIYLDAMIGTLEEARVTAELANGNVDHRTRIDATKVELAMMGVIGPAASREQPAPVDTDSRMISAELAALTGAALWEAAMRQVQAAQAGVPVSQIPKVVFDLSEEGVREERSKGIMLPIEAAESGKEILQREREARNQEQQFGSEREED
jgi:hypothetical protein